MLSLRYATAEDACVITEHRHRMFAENGFAADAALTQTDAGFEPWVRERLADGRYLGLLLEEGSEVVAGAGVFFADFPSHWIDPQPVRAYVLNVYTVPEARGRGYARRLVEAVVEECRLRRIRTVVLHASPQGRPVYAKLGFTQSDEMMLCLHL